MLLFFREYIFIVLQWDMPKGQLISKCLFGVFDFLQKTNKNKSHSSKIEFICSFFGENVGLKKSFRFCLTFTQWKWVGHIPPVFLTDKVGNCLKGSLDLIPSPSVKIQIICGKVCLRCKGKTLLGIVKKLLSQQIFEYSKFVDPAIFCFIPSSKLSGQ